jgi:hypothetical protein
MSESNHSSKEKEFQGVTCVLVADADVGTVKDIVSSGDELLSAIGYKQVRYIPCGMS